jgi:hypothetical protein
MAGTDADRILEKLAKDVEAAVHALYRGEVRQMTARTRTMSILRDAQSSLQKALSDVSVGGDGARSSGASPRAPTPAAVMQSPRPSVSAPAPAGAAVGWSKEEGDAVIKCINAWLPMGPPSAAPPDSKCIPAARELAPTWGQREKAREAVKRISQP